MTIRMLWFLPLGVVTGMGGVQLARQFIRQDGPQHRAKAIALLLLTWFPMAVWLINQFINFERYS